MTSPNESAAPPAHDNPVSRFFADALSGILSVPRDFFCDLGQDLGINSPKAAPPMDPGLSGSWADAARRTQEAQSKAADDIGRADDKLASNMLKVTAADADAKQQLRRVQQDIVDQVEAMGDTLQTPAGQTQFAAFMHGKVGDIKSVLATADQKSKGFAAAQDALSEEYKATHPGGDLDKALGNVPDKGPDKGGKDADVHGGGQPAPAAPADPGGGAADPPADPAGVGDPLDPGVDPGIGGIGDQLGQILPAMMGGLGQLGSIPGQMAGMIPGMGGGGFPGMGGGLGGLDDGLRDPGLSGHHGDGDGGGDPPADPLQDPSLGSQTGQPGQNGQPGGSTDPAKADPLQDPGSQPGSSSGQTPTGAAPAASADPKAVTMPDSTVREAPSPQVAQAVREALAGTDPAKAFTDAGMSLPPAGQVGNNPVNPQDIAMGTVGEFSDGHQVVALSSHDVLVNGQVTPIEQMKTDNFLGWTNATTTPTQTPQQQPAPPTVTAQGPPPVPPTTAPPS